jgi:hypothetical protein
MKNGWRPQVWFGSLILVLSLECTLCLGASSTDTTGGSPGSAKVLNLTEQRFPHVSAAERKLVEAAADGTDADCAAPSDEDRVIRAELLAWLCVDLDVSKQVTGRGVSISGATIRGGLNLERAKISYPLQIVASVFEDWINLRDTHLVYLNLSGTRVPGLSLGGAEIERSLYLNNGFESKGEANLVGTKIGGDLYCTGGHFVGTGNQPALSANRANIEGAVFTNKGFTAQGEVILVAATIGSSLFCTGGQFVGTGNQPALSANRAGIKGSVFMDEGFTAQGEVDLGAATIGSNLDCTRGYFVGHGNQPALSTNSANIKGAVFMNKGFTAQGGVDLGVATIGSNLDCTGGHFVGSEKSVALSAAQAKIQGFVLLNRDYGTKEDFSAEGGLVFTSATIGGDLDCEGGRFAGKGNATALDAQSAKIDGSVYFRSETSADGDAKFNFAAIARDFQWTPRLHEHGLLDLQHAKVGSILMRLNKSLSLGYISIDGFVYDQIDELSSANSANPLRWISFQTHDRFLPQRYEQLYSVLRKMGFQEDALKVIISKNEKAGDFAIAEALSSTSKDFIKGRYAKVIGDLLTGLWGIFWYKLFGEFIGYGYTPWNALYASLAIVGFGYFVFKAGYAAEIIIPKDDKVSRRQLCETYPKFNAGIYSLEMFVPLVKLGVGDSWIPNAHGGASLRIGKKGLLKFGSLLRCYFWFHIIAGWVLTTLWVGGFTGLIKS